MADPVMISLESEARSQLTPKAPSLFSQALGISGTVGVLCAAISALNITVGALKLGVNRFWSQVLIYWHQLVHETILHNLFSLLQLHIPESYYEPIALWLIAAGICFRTLLQARRFILLAQQQRERAVRHGTESAAEVDIGTLETAAARWPYPIFVVASFLLCVSLMPAVALRLLFGNRPVYLPWTRPVRPSGFAQLHQPAFKVRVKVELEQGVRQFNYRTIALIQLAAFAGAFAILFATNAGLS